jgi:hypothetical protein
MSADLSATNVKHSSLILGLGIFWLLAAVVLLIFQLATPPQIKIEWTTATEQNTAAFQLYRSTAVDGEFVLITDEAIPSQGNALAGGSYSFVDTDVLPGVTYYYLLEEIEYDSTANRYTDDMKTAKVSRIAWWAIFSIALFILVGVGFIVTGLRQRD